MDIDKLREKLLSSEKSDISEALDIIYENEIIELADAMVEVLKRETSRSLREKILVTIGKLLNKLGSFNKLGFETIKQMFLAEDAFIRNGVISLIKRSDGTDYAHLRELSRCEDKDIRKFVIDALSNDNCPQSIEIIHDLITDKDINIRITSVDYLGDFKTEEYSDEIADIFLNTKNPMLKISCLESIAKIGKKPQKFDLIYKELTEKPDNLMIFSFLKILGAFGGEDSFSYLEKILLDEKNFFLKNVIDAVELILINTNLKMPENLKNAFFKRVNTASSNDKYEIMKLLAKNDGDEMAQNARENLESKDDMIMLSAIEIIADTGCMGDIDRLEEIASETESDDILEAVGDAVMKIKERFNQK